MKNKKRQNNQKRLKGRLTKIKSSVGWYGSHIRGLLGEVIYNMRCEIQYTLHTFKYNP